METNLNISDKNITFLKHLKEERANRPFHIADPVFWTIRQFEKRPTHEDFADGMVYFYDDGEQYEIETFEELYDILQEQVQADPSDIEAILNHMDLQRGRDNMTYTLEDAIHYIRAYTQDYNLKCYPYIEEPVIKNETLFLTRQEAQLHLKQNHYHYNDTAEIYSFIAWRSPNYEKLMKIINNL